MLVFLTVLIMLGVCYAYWHEGLLTACCMFVNVLLAGLVAFSVFEPIANELDPMLGGSFLEGYEDCLCLIVLFCLTLGLLRLATSAWRTPRSTTRRACCTVAASSSGR